MHHNAEWALKLLFLYTRKGRNNIPTCPPPSCQHSVPRWGKYCKTRLVHHNILFVGFLSVSLQSQPGYLTSECCRLNQCLLSFSLGCSEDSKWGAHTLHCSDPCVCQIYQPAHPLSVCIKYEQQVRFSLQGTSYIFKPPRNVLLRVSLDVWLPRNTCQLALIEHSACPVLLIGKKSQSTSGNITICTSL